MNRNFLIGIAFGFSLIGWVFYSLYMMPIAVVFFAIGIDVLILGLILDK